jgi:hypothetical protein
MKCLGLERHLVHVAEHAAACRLRDTGPGRVRRPERGGGETLGRERVDDERRDVEPEIV